MRFVDLFELRSRRAAMLNNKDNRMRVCGVGVALLCVASVAHGRGVSPYLPLHLSPEIERQIERVLILADRPVVKRPIAAATVFDALPAACERDAAACAAVRRYLAGYMRRAGIAYASAAVTGNSGSVAALPNRHGAETDSAYELAAAIYWQPSDYVLFSGGTVANDSETTPTGSMVSLGMEYAQLDVGYRDHWFSPMTESAMLMSTHAATLPSVTLSNYSPISRMGFRYELFIGEMSDGRILTPGGTVVDNPRLAGIALSIEPFPGWSLGINRIMQYGGAGRPDGLGDLLDAFFSPSSDNTPSGGVVTNEFGNQAASFTTRFLVPGSTPFAVYFEYAGEDTSTTSDVRLGNAALSAGVQFPLLRDRFDLTVEMSEWQNAWYAHHVYQGGLLHEGHVIGHWAADWRVPQDAVGARSWMAGLGWRAKGGADVEATYRNVRNEDYGAAAYAQGHLLQARYSRPWKDFFVGVETELGRDVFDESFARASAFIRF